MLDKLIIKNKKGFTLIELLIVVAIIGILAAIAIPQFAQYRVRAFNSAAQSDLRTIRTTLESHFAERFAYPDDVTAYTTGTIQPGTAEQVDAPIGLSARVEAGYAGGDAAAGTLVFYNVQAFNQQGNRTYATSHNESNLYVFGSVNAPLQQASGFDWTGATGWTAL